MIILERVKINAKMADRVQNLLMRSSTGETVGFWSPCQGRCKNIVNSAPDDWNQTCHTNNGMPVSLNPIRIYLVVFLVLSLDASSYGYSVLTHEAMVDSLWD